MALSEPLRTPQRRINPHRGLVIDVPRWTEAHDYHRIQLARHGLAMHSPGIVWGLEVTAGHEPSTSVVVHPGAALDQEGRLIIVPESHRLDLSLNSAGTAYVALQYREVPESATSPPVDEWTQSPYALEVYSISGGREMPEEPCLELARVRVSGAGAAISDALDPRMPGFDEIDLRYRRESGAGSSREISVGVGSLDGRFEEREDHPTGAMDLIRAINQQTKYRGHFAGLFDLTHHAGECDLLLVSGREPLSLSAESREVLRTLLDRGITMFVEFSGAAAEGAAEDPSAFRQSFESLAADLETPVAPMEGNHPLLAACHRFSAPPVGNGDPGRFLAGGGLVYGEGDYGRLWSGGRPGDTPSRESIRSATEFGVNLAVYAAERRHAHLLRMAVV